MCVFARLLPGRFGIKLLEVFRDFSFLQNVQIGSEGSSIPSFEGYRSSSPGIKRLEREADQSLPSSVEIKNEWT